MPDALCCLRQTSKSPPKQPTWKFRLQGPMRWWFRGGMPERRRWFRWFLDKKDGLFISPQQLHHARTATTSSTSSSGSRSCKSHQLFDFFAFGFQTDLAREMAGEAPVLIGEACKGQSLGNRGPWKQTGGKSRLILKKNTIVPFIYDLWIRFLHLHRIF